MNSQFLEFWGTFLTNVAQGQKQLEEMSQWMKQGFAGMDDLADLFRQCYGLKSAEAEGPKDQQAWQNAVDEFQRTFAQFAAEWGWVSQKEHQQVLEHCAALEKEVQTQKTTIEQLRKLLAQKGLGYGEVLKHMQGAIKEQGEQFQALMDSIHKAFKDPS